MVRAAFASARSLAAPLSARARRWLVVSAVVHTLQRGLVVLTAVAAVSRDVTGTLAAGAVLTLSLGASSVLRAALSKRIRCSLVDAILGALLGGDVLAVLDEDEVLAAVLEGTYFGEQLLGEDFPALAGDAIAGAALCVFLGWSASPETLVVGGLALIVAGALLVSVRFVASRLTLAADEAYAPVYEALTTAVGARLELVASGHERRFREGVLGTLVRWSKLAIRSDVVVGVMGRAPVAGAALVVGAAVVLDRGWRGAVTNTALADAAILASAVPAFVGLSRSALEVVRKSARTRPLLALLNLAPRADSARTAPPPPLPAPIAWRDVSFAYPAAREDKRVPVLSNVSVLWKPGQILVVRGPNGSGKSTLLKLLLGLVEPTSGCITIGEADLSSLDLSAWRRSLAYLPQRPYLSDQATVRQAIRLVAPYATDDAVLAALRRVELLPVLAARGSASPLSVRVGTLSAGQKQRLALARVLSVNASVLILDEPDANLDRSGLDLVARIVREQKGMVALAVHAPELVALGDVVVDLSRKPSPEAQDPSRSPIVPAHTEERTGSSR